MQYVCDAPNGKTWFRIETEDEATQESRLMQHAVEKHFRQAKDAAAKSFRPASSVFIEQEIGLKAHLRRTMPQFLTLRDANGDGLATAMLPPTGQADGNFRAIIVGMANSDPYPGHSDAILALAKHIGKTLPRDRCFPYQRG